MISELILKKRMIKGEIEINRDSISKRKETLLQESSRKADPAQKEILSTLLSFYLNWELKQSRVLINQYLKTCNSIRAYHIF